MSLESNQFSAKLLQCVSSLKHFSIESTPFENRFAWVFFHFFWWKWRFYGRCQTDVFGIFLPRKFAEGFSFQQSFSNVFDRWSSFHRERTLRRSIRVIFVYEQLFNKNEDSLLDAKHIHQIFSYKEEMDGLAAT